MQGPRTRIDLSPELIAALGVELAQVNYNRALQGQPPMCMSEWVRQRLQLALVTSQARLPEPPGGAQFAFGGDGTPR